MDTKSHAYPKCHAEAATTQGEGLEATIYWTTAAPMSTLFSIAQSSNSIKKLPHAVMLIFTCEGEESNHMPATCWEVLVKPGAEFLGG